MCVCFHGQHSGEEGQRKRGERRKSDSQVQEEEEEEEKPIPVGNQWEERYDSHCFQRAGGSGRKGRAWSSRPKSTQCNTRVTSESRMHWGAKKTPGEGRITRGESEKTGHHSGQTKCGEMWEICRYRGGHVFWVWETEGGGGGMRKGSRATVKFQIPVQVPEPGQQPPPPNR